MQKTLIAAMAVLMMMAFVPNTPAQLPGGVQEAACDLGAGAVPLSLLVGTHAGTAPYNTPGSNANVHVFAFCGEAGDGIDFFVDNVNTPSDLWACVTATPNSPCNPTFYNAILNDLGGDDEKPCSVMHAYACPAGIAPLPADDGDGVYFIRVGTWSAPGPYQGTLTVNGATTLLLPS